MEAWSCDNSSGDGSVSPVTTPEPGSETPIQRFRMPLAAWIAFGKMCKRRGTVRARHLFDLMWADIRRHGSDDEKAVFVAADIELRARRSRRPRGQPPDGLPGQAASTRGGDRRVR